MWLWRLLGKKTVFDHHDLTPELFTTKFHVEHSPVLSLFYFAERCMLHTVHKVISTNESYKNIAMQRGRRSSKDVVVVRNAPDYKRFTVMPPKPDLRHSAKYLVAFLGEMGNQDGVDVLIRAIKPIQQAMGPEGVHFVLMGAGPYFNRVVEYAKELGASDSITFTGRADNETICRVLSSADLAVDPCPPSPHADLSTATKIMEYMYFSLPIVAFDLLETRRSGADAVCYAENTENAFVREIVGLLRDEVRRKALGRAARSRLDSTLSWNCSAQTLVNLMRDLVEAPTPQLEDLPAERMLQADGSTAELPIAEFKPHQVAGPGAKRDNYGVL